MKIAFVGDSFCRDIIPKTYKEGDIAGCVDVSGKTCKPYPYLVAKELDATIIIAGDGGDCLYHVMERFMLPVAEDCLYSEHENDDVIGWTKQQKGIWDNQMKHHRFPSILELADYTIFCITEPSRLANYRGTAINPLSILDNQSKSLADKLSLIFNIPHINEMGNRNDRNPRFSNRYDKNYRTLTKSETKKLITAAQQYYMELWHPEYHAMAHTGILMQIDQLMKQKNKKCMWFPGFHNSIELNKFHKTNINYNVPWSEVKDYFIPTSGPMGNRALIDISISEGELLGKGQKEIDIDSSNDSRLNHLNIENNKIMAKLIIDVIKNNSFSQHMIKMEDYFYFSEKNSFSFDEI